MTRMKLRRAELSAHFAQLAPARVAMEACGSAQHWARQFAKLAHKVKLIAAQFVRPFVKTNKNDVADAAAMWTAAQQPEVRFVGVKTEEQRAVLALHALRERRKKNRTAVVNQIHGLMGEFGVELQKGRRTMLPKAAASLDDATSVVPALLRTKLRRQIEEIRRLTDQMAEIKWQIASWQRQQEDCERIGAIPGVGLLTATACGGHNRGVGDDLPLRAAVRRLSGPGAAADWHRRAGAIAWHQQARPHLPMHLADPRSAECAREQPGGQRPEHMIGPPDPAAPPQRGGRGARKQDGATDLGAARVQAPV